MCLILVEVRESEQLLWMGVSESLEWIRWLRQTDQLDFLHAELVQFSTIPFSECRLGKTCSNVINVSLKTME